MPICSSHQGRARPQDPGAEPRRSRATGRAGRPRRFTQAMTRAHRRESRGRAPPGPRSPPAGAKEPSSRAQALATHKMASTDDLTPPSPGPSGLRSRGPGTGPSLVRRANKSAWPTSSNLIVSHLEIKIINTQAHGGWRARGEFGGIGAAAQGPMQQGAACRRRVRVSRTPWTSSWGRSGLGWGSQGPVRLPQS